MTCLFTKLCTQHRGQYYETNFGAIYVQIWSSSQSFTRLTRNVYITYAKISFITLGPEMSSYCTLLRISKFAFQSIILHHTLTCGKYEGWGEEWNFRAKVLKHASLSSSLYKLSMARVLRSEKETWSILPRKFSTKV